ncbi:HutD family protein [Myroides guanonis]|uniref:HutD protein n=1 Tax=Myroides guanonis TaxID=1150112 RepID=A0A1I3LDT0_9FLAO|nr:HutD family protein [Myroides guanonis]SFI82837.1 HutD protein [Myroides guanonis]
MSTKIVPFESLTAAVWNGGKTFQYYIHPLKSNYSDKNFYYRISSATIEIEESLFTQFKGYNRYLIMLDNNLNIKHNGIIKSFKPLEIFSFDSNDEVLSYSKGSDFNLMVTKQLDNASIRIDSGLIEVTSRKTILFALKECMLNIDNSNKLIKSKDLIILQSDITSILLPIDFIVIEI